METPGTGDTGLREQVLAVFADREDKRGTPVAPTQHGFLALAFAGKDVWNAWRAAYPKKEVDSATWTSKVLYSISPVITLATTRILREQISLLYEI